LPVPAWYSRNRAQARCGYLGLGFLPICRNGKLTQQEVAKAMVAVRGNPKKIEVMADGQLRS
jgi:hypothetical protein